MLMSISDMTRRVGDRIWDGMRWIHGGVRWDGMGGYECGGESVRGGKGGRLGGWIG